MTTAAPIARRRVYPTRRSALTFAAKAALLRLRRAGADLLSGPPRLGKAPPRRDEAALAQSRTPLWPDPSQAERGLQIGKVQNLRVACRSLDGVMIPAGATFSFWRQVGPPIRVRGYAPGRMLQQGCMVASVGGGLCQLSNALYEVALAAGCQIVERHAHSSVVPGSAAAAGRDATVAWNYVDLRFSTDRPLRLSAGMDRDFLTVALHGEGPAATREHSDPPAPTGPAANGCASCGETACFRHERAAPMREGRRAILVDEAWPEFLEVVTRQREPADWLGLPIDGAALRLKRYAWPTAGFDKVFSAPLSGLRRAVTLRRLGAQGAARRRAELAASAQIAADLGRRLTADITHLTVAQSYLPFLWREGHLGGREVSVLMTRLPMGLLQASLDAQAAAHPGRATLADFRASAELVAAEEQALAQATRLITPHARVASLFGPRAQRLAWSKPPAGPLAGSPRDARRLVFPGPTVARKGAYAVRAAALALDLTVTPLGSELEGEGFWDGVRIEQTGDWRDAAVMVQPALVEDQPRRLLAALAVGMPVIATAACGLDPQPGLVIIEPDDPQSLIEALDALLPR